MSRHLPATPAVPTHLLSSHQIPLTDAHSHLQSYLLSTLSSQPWSHSHDAGTTASLKKLELSLRGIHGPAANTHFLPEEHEHHQGAEEIVTTVESAEEVIPLEDDTFSKPDTDEGGESERQRIYETIEDLEVAEEIRDEDEGLTLKELQSVRKVEEGEGDVEMFEEKQDEEGRGGGGGDAGRRGSTNVVDKEERKRLKKLRLKEEKRRKEAERAAERE